MQNVLEFRRKTDPGKIQWVTIIGFSAYSILSIAALFFFSWQNFAAFMFFWWLTGSPGVGVGYHRLLTHRGFKTPKWVEYTLTLFGTLALQGGPIGWVTTHRLHHAFTETDKDPHSTKGGLYWAHMGWLFTGTAQDNDEATIMRYAPDLQKDPVHRFFEKYYVVPTVILAVALFAIGGFSMVLWGVFLRTTVCLHATWLVNSANHKWGSRRFETTDDSTNSWWIAILAWGEGWHNNHHANPTVAKHGFVWYEFDANWISITVLKWMGLATNIKLFDMKKYEASLNAKPVELKRAA
jgi:sn-1 stearoyl-lipid 9-desaturase